MSLATRRDVSPAVPNDLESFWVPFTPNRSFKKQPRLITRAKGMHYYTPEGKAVIDGSSGDRVDCRNELLHDIADTRPGTDIVDLNRFVLTQARAGEDMFVDSVHLSPDGGRLVSEWLLPALGPGV